MRSLRQVVPDTSRFSSSTVMLVLVNLVPLAGVLFWGWQAFTVVLLYWAENVILGVFLIIKMIFAAPAVLPEKARNEMGAAVSDSTVKMIGHAAKLFFIPFFCVHYGIFCLVHGMFVFFLFGKGTPFGMSFGTGGGGAGNALDGQIWIGVAAIVLYQAYLLVTQYFIRGGYRRTSVDVLFRSPYGRIVVLHIAILAGAFAITLFGSSIVLLVILVVGKILIELKLQDKSPASPASDGH